MSRIKYHRYNVGAYDQQVADLRGSHGVERGQVVLTQVADPKIWEAEVAFPHDEPVLLYASTERGIKRKAQEYVDEYLDVYSPCSMLQGVVIALGVALLVVILFFLTAGVLGDGTLG